jgi:hypothetical protein
MAQADDLRHLSRSNASNPDCADRNIDPPPMPPHRLNGSSFLVCPCYHNYISDGTTMVAFLGTGRMRSSAFGLFPVCSWPIGGRHCLWLLRGSEEPGRRSCLASFVVGVRSSALDTALTGESLEFRTAPTHSKDIGLRAGFDSNTSSDTNREISARLAIGPRSRRARESEGDGTDRSPAA